MKTKFKFILTITLVAFFATFMQAQRGWQSNRLPAVVELTDAQQKQMDEINASFREKMEALRNEAPSDAKKTEMQTLMQEHKAAVDAVLTDEQKAKLAAFQAAQKTKMEERRKNAEALRKELSTYQQANVLPILRAQRAKLDAKISAEDQQLIAQLRSKMQQLRKNAPKNFADFPGKKGHPGEFGRKPAHKPDFAPDQKMHDQINTLIDKYGADIDALYAEIAPQEKQWQTDRQAIMTKYRPENQAKEAPMPRKKAWAERSNDKRDLHKKVMFLLMDPNATEVPVKTAQVERKVNAFPNPASGSQNLEFDVLEAGKVTVDIVDRQGNVIKNVFSGTLEKGTNKLEVSTADLKDKFYFYRITDAKGTTTKPFTVR